MEARARHLITEEECDLIRGDAEADLAKGWTLTAVSSRDLIRLLNTLEGERTGRRNSQAQSVIPENVRSGLRRIHPDCAILAYEAQRYLEALEMVEAERDTLTSENVRLKEMLAAAQVENNRLEALLAKEGSPGAWKLLEAAETDVNRQKAKVDWLAECAAARACPANGHVQCDKFIKAGCDCPEATDLAYRKKCWLEIAERESL